MMLWCGVVLLVALAGCSAHVVKNIPVYQQNTLELERSNEHSRIVSGWESEEGQFPFQISLRNVDWSGTVTGCGGSIIHAEWGLTAAHCTANRVTIVIRAGTVNLSRPALIFETTTYFNHPLYVDALTIVQPHDISLLKFGRILPFSDLVKPILIQPSVEKDRNYGGEVLVASGWGRTWTNGASPEHMNWVYQYGISNLECQQAYAYNPIIAASTICTNYYNVSSQSTCQGDSGGPLTILEQNGNLVQVGVASFVSGAGCHSTIPAGFIRPGHYHEWYTFVTGFDFDWDPSTTTQAPTTTTEATTTTTEAQTDAPTTTEAPTDAPTDAPTTTEAPTDAPTTTEAPTDAPTDAPTTTEAPTDAPTDAPTTTEAPTDAPTDAPTTTEAPTDAPTDAPTTTEAPTDAPTTTEAPTDAPTDAPTTTEAPTDAPTDAPTTTEAPTDAPTTTEAPTDAPTDAPTTTDVPITTEATTTEAPTDAPATTAAPTDAPNTTEAPTDAPTTTWAPTDAPITTEVPPTTEAEGTIPSRVLASSYFPFPRM